MPTMAPRYRSERLVGREREISRLAVALEAAAEGRTRPVLLSGPSGSGVSRLMDETARRVAALSEPFAVIRCRARSGFASSPYAPISAGLRSFFDTLDDAELARVVGPAAEPLARLVPALVARLGVPPTTRRLTIAPERRAAWLNEAVHGLLERSGERRPVLLVMEDLQHADAATRGLATFLTRVRRPSRLCVTVTFESRALPRGHRFLDDLAMMLRASEPPDRLELAPLTRDELVQLIVEIDGERPNAATVLLVAERSAGNPLVAEEILAARRELSGVSLGTSLEQLVDARIARRSDECRHVLRLLAPAGRPLGSGDLARAAAILERLTSRLMPRSATHPRRATGALDADLQAGIDEARGHGFLADLPDGSFDLRHDSIALAITAGMLPPFRVHHREALAEALEDRPAEALPHWLAARRSTPARDAALATAVFAESLDAPTDALDARELALELGSADEDDATAARQLTLAGEAALAAGRPDRALAYLERAADHIGERADRAATADLHETIGRVARSLGDHQRATTEHRRAASIAPTEPSVRRARVLASLAQTLMLQGLFAEAARTARASIDVARAVGGAALEVEGHATCTLGIARAWSADATDAIALLERAREIARSLDHADDGFRATLNLATGLTLLGRREAAIEVTRRAIDEARRDGLEVAYGNALRGNIAEGLFLVGRWDEARETIRIALEWSPAPEAFADASVTAAMLEVETGVDERAASLLGWRPLELDQAPDPQLEVPATRAAASFALWRGDLDDARRAAEHGWSLVRRAEDWVLTSRMASTCLEVDSAMVADAQERRVMSEISSARGRGLRVLAEAEAVLAASGVPVDAPSRSEAEAHLLTARAFAARLDGRDDPTAWDRAARAWEGVGEPYQVARARWRQAEALLPGRDARQGRPEARIPLLEAWRIGQELHARPLLRELASLARRAMITLPTDAQPDEQPDAQAPLESLAEADRQEAAPDAPPLPVPARSGPRSRSVEAAREPVGPVARAIAGGLPDSRPETAFGLSKRELEVLALIVHGRTNREIGEHLFISQKTVGVHVGNILAKLGASGRVEAAMVAVRLALVPTPAGRGANLAGGPANRT